MAKYRASKLRYFAHDSADNRFDSLWPGTPDGQGTARRIVFIAYKPPSTSAQLRPPSSSDCVTPASYLIDLWAKSELLLFASLIESSLMAVTASRADFG